MQGSIGFQIMMCVMAFLVNLLVAGCFAFVYGTKMKYENGMLFGVHMAKEAQQNPEVMVLMEQYAVRMKRFYSWNVAGAVVSAALAFSYTSIFMLGWMFWLFEFTIGSMVYICRYHRKLYDIKIRNRWFAGEGANIVVIDTAASAKVEERKIRAVWHLPALLIVTILCVTPQVRVWVQEEKNHLFIPVVSIFVSLIFSGLHFWMNHRRCDVISENTKKNTAIQVRERRLWGWIWLVGNYTNLAGVGVLLWQISQKGYLDTVDFIVCIVLSMAGGSFILAAIFWMRQKRKEVLKTEEPLNYVDDDVYWKNGWYHNPQDRRFMVPDRMCSTNYSLNMGKSAVRYLAGVSIVAITLVVLWMLVVFFRMDFTRPQLQIGDTKVFVQSAEYGISFDRDDIKEVVLLDSFPKEEFHRTHGLSDSRQLLGKFKGEESGKAMLYIRRGETPVLRIELSEYVVFINSEDAEKVQMWYEELSS